MRYTDDMQDNMNLSGQHEEHASLSELAKIQAHGAALRKHWSVVGVLVLVVAVLSVALGTLWYQGYWPQGDDAVVIPNDDEGSTGQCVLQQVQCIQAPCPPILVCPTPETSQLNGWTSYSSDAGNFSLSIPGDWDVTSSASITSFRNEKTQILPDLTIAAQKNAATLYKNAGAKSLQEYLSKLPSNGDVAVSFQGQDAWTYDYKGKDFESRTIFIEHKGVLYTLTQNRSVNELTSSQVLSTFMFNDLQTAIEYKNTAYGLRVMLPVSWRGYTIKDATWSARIESAKVIASGVLLQIQHPASTTKKPRQDIPIMVLTVQQWEKSLKDDWSFGAAPIGPSELARNEKYVFALPARYNYSFPVGFEEVQGIIDSKAITAF